MNTVVTTVLALMTFTDVLNTVNATSESPMGPIQQLERLLQAQTDLHDARRTNTFLIQNQERLRLRLTEENERTTEAIQKRDYALERSRQLRDVHEETAFRAQHQGSDAEKVMEKDVEINILQSKKRGLEAEIARLKMDFDRRADKTDELQSALNHLGHDEVMEKRAMEAEVGRLTRSNDRLRSQLQISQRNRRKIKDVFGKRVPIDDADESETAGGDASSIGGMTETSRSGSENELRDLLKLREQLGAFRDSMKGPTNLR